MPLISVIVPIYNVEPFVGACIDSLRAQTFSDFQVVCVDDGSTDASADIARRAAAGDGRFLFAERENGGLSAARNTALDLAEGDYVCFLDSDDSYEPWALARLADAASRFGTELVDFSARTVYESRRVRKAHEEDYSARDDIEGVLTGQELFVRYWDLLQYKSSACFHLISRALIEREGLRFGEGLLHEDELFTPLLYAHARSAVFLNEALYLRRMRADSIMTRRPGMVNVRSLFRIAQLLHAWLIEHAEEVSVDFADAVAEDVCSLRDVAFQYLQGVDEADRAAFLDSLGIQDRLDYDLTVRYVSSQAHERYTELRDSLTYRVGDAVVSVPRWVRERLRGM